MKKVDVADADATNISDQSVEARLASNVDQMRPQWLQFYFEFYTELRGYIWGASRKRNDG